MAGGEVLDAGVHPEAQQVEQLPAAATPTTATPLLPAWYAVCPTYQLGQVGGDLLLTLRELSTANELDAEESDDGVDDDDTERPRVREQCSHGLEHVHLLVVSCHHQEQETGRGSVIEIKELYQQPDYETATYSKRVPQRCCPVSPQDRARIDLRRHHITRARSI